MLLDKKDLVNSYRLVDMGKQMIEVTVNPNVSLIPYFTVIDMTKEGDERFTFVESLDEAVDVFDANILGA
jgi:hypothetical protein